MLFSSLQAKNPLVITITSLNQWFPKRLLYLRHSFLPITAKGLRLFGRLGTISNLRNEKDMKKILSLTLALILILGTCCIAPNAFALDYTRTLGNEATFETMAEARVNGPVAMQQYSA